MLHPILLEIHKKCKHKDNFDYHCGFFDALRCLDARIKAGEIIIGRLPQEDFDEEELEQDIKNAVEATRNYKPGEGISVLETHERMRREGKL